MACTVAEAPLTPWQNVPRAGGIGRRQDKALIAHGTALLEKPGASNAERAVGRPKVRTVA
jgi:hypothetical protein